MGDGELHKGHRQRMLKKYIMNGIDCFEDHEKLEIALFTIFSRCNTNDISHRLISEFGSLNKVFETDYKDLQKIKGIGENAAIMISFLGDLFRSLVNKKPKGVVLDSTKKIIDYCCGLYTAAPSKEIVYGLFLDSKFNLISQSEIEKGGTNFAGFDVKTFTKIALNSDCTDVILVHNHPSGSRIASTADINTTREIADLLEKVDVRLADHIIVCGETGHSLRSMEIMKDIWS